MQEPRSGAPERVADDAIVAMYHEHANSVFAYLARRVGRDLAQDLLSETFRQAIESHAGYDSKKGSQRVWLFGVASNVLRRHWRTEQRHLRALDRLHGEAGTVFDPLLSMPERIDAESESTLVLAAITELDAIDRDVLLLSCWEELSSADVAAALDLSPGAVRTRLHRVRARLRTAIDDHASHETERTMR